MSPRREFTALTRLVEECVNNLALQFKRIAQIQAELDHIRAAWSKADCNLACHPPRNLNI